jgi:hypothetical protein
MDEYVRYVLLCDGIDAEQLLNEIVALEKTAYDALAKTPEEKALAAKSRQVWLTSKLVEFGLTPPEWLEYKSAKENNTDLASFESFYREAEARDTAMAQNILSSLNLQPRSDSYPTPIALLVTGGFHAEGMAEQLTEQGATVISYIPKIEKVDTAQGSAYLSVFTQEKTPLEKLFQGEKLFLAQDPWTMSAQRQAAAGIIGVEEILTPGPRPREMEERESAQLGSGEVFEGVDTALNTADVSWNGDPVAQVTLNSGVMSMGDQSSLSIGSRIFRKIVELGDPLRAFKQFSEFNLSLEGFSRLFAEYVVNHFGNEVIDNRLDIPFAKKNGEEGVDKIDLFHRLEPHLSKKGLDYLRQLLDARSRGDKSHLLFLQADYPTKALPRLDLFNPLDEAMWIQWTQSGDWIAAIRLSEGCSRGCEHCYFNPSKHVVVLPYFRLLQILNRMKTSNKAEDQFAAVITLHEDNEIFDYYDPVFEADVADVVLALRREFPNQSIGITTRGWYQGDRVAPQAAKKLANLRRQDPSAINLIYSLDLFDRMGNVTRMFARILVNLDLLAGGNGSMESAPIFLQPTHDQGSELGVRRLISWTRFLATANLDLIAPKMETSPISIFKGRGKKLQSSSGHPVDSCIWGLHIFPSGRAARKTKSKENYEYPVQPRLLKLIPIPQWSESVSLWTGGLDVTDLIPKKITSREDPLKDIFPRRSGPSMESGKKGTGWIGVGVAWGWGVALGTWKKMNGRLEQRKSILSFARDYVSHEAGRRAAWVEDLVNAMVGFFVGLVAGQKGDVLAWLSLGTLSPPLSILFPVVLMIGVWFVLFVVSHRVASKKLEIITGGKPSVLKSIHLFGFYLASLVASALLGAAMTDLWTPVIVVTLSVFQLGVFPAVRTRHNTVNMSPVKAGINLKDRRRLLVSLLLAFVPLGPLWASGLGVLPEQRYLPIYIRHAIPADILPFEEVIKKAILNNAEEGRTIVFALENGGFGSQEIVQAARETTLDINKWKNIFEETQLRIKNGGVSEEVAKYFSSRNTFQGAIWRLIYWAKNQKIKTKIIFEEPEFDLFEMEVHGVKLLIEANDAFLSGDFSRTVHLLEQNFRYSLEAIKCRDEKYHKKLDHSLNDPSNFVIDLRGAAHRPRFDIPFEIREIGLQVNNPFGTSHLLVLEREGLSVEKTERERQLISTVVAGTILTYLHSSLGALPKAEQELEMIKEILDNLSLDDYKAISSKAGSMVKGNAKNVRVGIGITAVVDWLKRNNKIPPRYLPYFQNIKISENARNQCRATSLWGLKFAEWLGSTTGGVAGRERFGAGYRRFAAFIEWGVSAKAAFWGVMGTMAFAGSPVGWAVAPAMGMVYGILFFGSHFIPKSMAPVTKVKVGVFEALALGMFYGVLIGVTPFLLGVVPFMGVPEFGVQMAGVLWGLTGFLHSSFDREKPREAGERAAWNLVGQLASIHGVFETVMPGIQSDHTDQIVGKGGLSADSLSTILARFKNDVEFREGFVGAIQKAMEKGGLSSAQMNLLSVLVKGATGQPIAFLHVLGKTPLVELAKLETLSGQVNSPEKGGFTMALVVPFGQTEGVNFRVASLKAKGVQIFEVNLGAAGWNVETLSTLEGQMSSWLGRANGIVATVGSEVGIKPTDVEALDSESRLRAALKTAVTLGESIQNFLRYLQVLASNA